MADTNVRVVITAKDEASAVLKKVNSNVEGFGNNVANFVGKNFQAAGVAAGVALAGIGAAVVDVTASFEKSQNVVTQLNAVLKSTGSIAGVTSDMAQQLASSLQKVTKFSDEDVLSVEDLLLTFTHITKDIFPQSTEVVLDMATALGEDTKSAAIQLGKALQDPVLGITALRRVGVNFSDKQKEVIKDLVDTGHSAQAQAMILKELQTEFGGSARAAGSTFAGQLAILGNEIDDVKEKLGSMVVKALTPFLEKAVAIADKALPKLEEFFNFLSKHQTVVVAIAGALAGLAILAIGAFVVAFGGALVLMAAFAAAGAGIAALAYTITTNWSNIKTFFADLWNNITSTTSNALNTVRVFLDNTLKAITDGLTFFRDHFFEIVGFMIGFVATLPLKIIAIFLILLAQLPPLLDKLTKAIQDAFVKAFENAINFIIHIDWAGVFNNIKNAFVAGWDSIKDAAVNTFNFIKNMNWGGIFAGVGKGIGNSVIDLLNGAMKGAFSGVPGIKDHVPQIPHLATGGIVTRPTLALIGEAGPEAVVPLNKANGISTTINISVNAGAFMGNPSDARQYAKLIIEHMKDIAGAKNMTAAELLS